MNSSSILITRSEKPALELISLATMAPELARKSLRNLLIADPGHFGKISSNSFKAVLRILQETTYESIGYVGYSPSLEHLQATIHLNENAGYSVGHCISREYVRFYLSYDSGSSWFDQGLSSFTVQNELGPMPRQVTLWVGISSSLTRCFLDRLPVVRTILSWNTPPPENAPNWIPMWGDVLDAQLRPEDPEALFLRPGLSDFPNSDADCSAIWTGQ